MWIRQVSAKLCPGGIASSLIAVSPLACAPSSPFIARSAVAAKPSLLSPASALFARGSKYPTYKHRLPSLYITKQSEPTAILKKMLKMKFFRLKKGKAGQRPRAPNYGRDDFCLGKMNI